MFLVLVYWFITTFVFISFGNLLIFVWNKLSGKKERYSLLSVFSLGMAFIAILLLIRSLLYPINFSLVIAIAFFALGFAIIDRKNLIKQLRELWQRFTMLGWLAKVIILLIFTSTLLYSLLAPTIYDFGLYHEPTMLWNNEYAVVPGLANLHGRFGFNSTFLLLSTLFYQPSYYPSVFPLIALYIIFFTCWLVVRFANSSSIIEKICYTILIAIFSLAFPLIISTTSTDVLVNLVVAFLILKFAIDREKVLEQTLLYILLPAFCITLKVSAAPILILTFFVFFKLIVVKNYKAFVVSLLLIVLIAIPWCTRTVLMTGYLIYPFPGIDIFPFDWKVPASLVTYEKDMAYAWAMDPTLSIEQIKQLSFSEWITSWFIRKPLIEKFTYLLAFLSPIVLLVSIIRKQLNVYIFLAWLTAFLGFIFGFINAPESRFSYGFIVMSGFIPLFAIGKQCFDIKAVFYSLQIVLILFLMLLNKSGFSLIYEIGNASAKSLIIEPQAIDTAKNKKQLEYYTYTINGIIFYTLNPIGTDMEACQRTCEDQCFDKPLPCAPYINTNLEMRGKTLQQGFRIKQE